MTRSRRLLRLPLLLTVALSCGQSSPNGPSGPGKGTTMPAGKGGDGMMAMPHGSGGATGGATGSGKGTAGMSGPAGPGHGGMMGMMPKMPMGSGGGVVIIGIPRPGTPGTAFPGGGPSGPAPLAPGCTPASAHECPSASGACATSGTSKPTGTTIGSICFFGPITPTTTTTRSTPAATIEYLHETAGGQEYYRFRITFDPAFVDNTYGANAIGWGTKGHTFKDLVGSDHAQLSLFDGGLSLVSMFKIDYITDNSTSSCGYGALGVSGGEGKMLVGDSKYILGSTSSLDRNLNGCGYCKSAACGGDCTSLSPATDAKWTPNSGAPNWDYRVVYEVWVDAAQFGAAGFGGASISFVHASPSKASSNTITVVPKPCDGCPDGTTLGETGLECVPKCPTGGMTGGTGGISGGTGGTTGTGETGALIAAQSTGETGAPVSQCPSDCAKGTRPVTYGQTVMCVPDCAAGTVPTSSGEGPACTSVCPDGSTPVSDGESTSCPIPL